MNIGIVSTWFDRGTAYVSRLLIYVLSKEHLIFIYAHDGEEYAKNDTNWDSTT